MLAGRGGTGEFVAVAGAGVEVKVGEAVIMPAAGWVGVRLGWMRAVGDAVGEPIVCGNGVSGGVLVGSAGSKLSSKTMALVGETAVGSMVGVSVAGMSATARNADQPASTAHNTRPTSTKPTTAAASRRRRAAIASTSSWAGGGVAPGRFCQTGHWT